MKITGETILFCMDTLAAEVTERYAQKENMTATEALRSFMATKTYDLLMDADSFLYLESTEYVLDMLDAEFSGCWDRWITI
jgi:hypothetical protein